MPPRPVKQVQKPAPVLKLPATQTTGPAYRWLLPVVIQGMSAKQMRTPQIGLNLGFDRHSH